MISDKKYQIIYTDPPWAYRNHRTGGSMKSGSESKYPTMTLDDIKQLPITQIANKDSVLFLWATVPLLPDCLSVLVAWGFEYKTTLFWRKIMSLGMGFWYRGQVELLLLGIKGKVKPFRIQKPNFIQSKVREHSRKPDEFYEFIEMTGLEPKIELFARNKREGWDSIGFDIDGCDIRESLGKLTL